ncbi:MAG TPA: hypothetical protein VFO07_10660 [Roseiflexaceae bacterium]|nr:hypothetical protein [Roseiflexaceae bacterium]
MLSPEEIAQQQELLAAYRRTLNVYLRQLAEIGRPYSPPGLVSGISDSREHIRRIKQTLRAAGVDVGDGPNDFPTETMSMLTVKPDTTPAPPDSPAPRRVAALAWLLVGVVVLAFAGFGAYWWYNNPGIGTAEQAETPTRTEPTADEAISAEEPPTEEPPAEVAPITQADVEALESELAKLNIELSETQVENVREFIANPATKYKVLAEHVLEVVGDQRFRETIYLDEIDVRYGEVVGQEHYADFDPDQLKAGMVRAWNEHYTDQQVESFDEIVEPQT